MSTIQPIAVPSSTPTSGQPLPGAAERLVDTFVRTGELDPSVLATLNSREVFAAAGNLSPRQQGLLQGALDAVQGTVNSLQDVAKTPSQRQAEDAREASEQMRLAEMRGQAELEMILAPYEKGDRPPAGLAWSVSVTTLVDGDPARIEDDLQG